MEVTILGCRGSYPVVYPELMYYGGDTTCIQIRADDAVVVLDAGTGIRKLGELPLHVTQVHLFITHLHWDHIIGFPLWKDLWTRSELTLHLYGLARTNDNFHIALERSITQPLYTRTREDVMMHLKYHDLQPGSRVEIDPGIVVRCAYANHPYRALGYRVEHQGKALAFVPDTAPFDRYLFADAMVTLETALAPGEREQLVVMQDSLIRLIGGADWLIYDSALLPEEYERLPHWGHSTMEQAINMTRTTSAGELIFFHHDPKRTDAELDALLRKHRNANPDLKLSMAYSGMVLEGGGR